MIDSSSIPKNQVASSTAAFQPGVVCSQQTTLTPSAMIERGKAAQRQLDRAAAQTWTAWRDICLALLAIQNLAMAAARAAQPRGTPYHSAVNHRLRLHGFDRYDKTARSIMVDVARNIEAVDAWRAALPPERLADLNYPRVVLTHWKQSLWPKAAGPSKRGKGSKQEPTPLDAALRVSSGWDAALWKALLAAKGPDWFREVMPAIWRPELQRLAGGQAIQQLKSRYPDTRLKRLGRRHLTFVHDTAGAPSQSESRMPESGTAGACDAY